ncbi:MAG: double zinc ribbon domain-containing protein [Anaerolineae bacterium]
MIRCPSCGSLNQDGRRLCENCGATLPQTKIRCPKCGALNPVGNIFCDQCNARLLSEEEMLPPELEEASDESHSAPAVKGISLPTRTSQGQETEDEAERLPDWLLDLSGDIEASEGEDSIEEKDVGGAAEYPDWLLANAAGLGTERSESSEEEETEETELEEEAEPLLFSESELPDWLSAAQSLAKTEDVEDAEGESDVDALGLEDELLFDAAAEEPGAGDEAPELQPEEASRLDADVPEWLIALSDQDLEEDVEPETPEEEVSAAEMPAAGILAAAMEDGPVEQEGELAESAASEDVDEEAMPDWLAELEIGAASDEGIAVVGEEDEETPPALLEGPTWLEDLAEAADSEPASTVPALIGDTSGDLDEEGTEEETFATDEPVPDWLRDLDLSTAERAQAQAPDSEGLARAELPAWLQELAPPDAEAVLRGEEGTSEAEGLTPADLPDWVKALRPEPRKEGEMPRRRDIFVTPAEPEGPLEGLPGVLPAVSLVDMPSDIRLSTRAEMPETVQAQAKLWQQLLEEPRSRERPIVQQRATGAPGSRPVRLFVAALVVIVIFLALWLIPEGMQLVQTAPSQVAPGIPAFVEGVDALQPGDQVVVAVEYTPAYAEEMAEIAAPILDHLKAREASVRFVSTLPEGGGLGKLLARRAQIDARVFGEGYLPGNANGIAAFMETSEGQAARHLIVLTSAPERLRWWIERNRLAPGAGDAAGVPVSVGVSAAAAPLVTPYLESSDVQGWVAGLYQAQAYRELRAGGAATGQAGDYARVIDVLMLGHWLLAALLFLALLYNLAAGRKGGR